MSKINRHQPANSTFPVQDQFNRVSMATGLTKIEWMATMLAAGWWQHSDCLPETIASEAIAIAIQILDETDKLFNADVDTVEQAVASTKIIQL